MFTCLILRIGFAFTNELKNFMKINRRLICFKDHSHGYAPVYQVECQIVLKVLIRKLVYLRTGANQDTDT